MDVGVAYLLFEVSASCETLASRQAALGGLSSTGRTLVNTHQQPLLPSTQVAATIAAHLVGITATARSSAAACDSQELSCSQQSRCDRPGKTMAALEEEASSEEDAVAAALGSNDEACSIAAWYDAHKNVTFKTCLLYTSPSPRD